MFGLDRSMMGSENPPLDQRSHPMDARHRLMRGNVRAEHYSFLMSIAKVAQRAIGSRPVGAYLRAGFNRSLYERNNRFGGVIVDAAQPNPPETFGLQRLHCDDDLCLGRIALAPLGASRRVPVTEMIPLGLKGDRQMLIGGLAGWAMALFLAGAAWLAW